MRNSMFLMHPAPRQSSNKKCSNIFQESRLNQSLPSIHKPLKVDRQAKLYDFVGSTQFKRKKFMPEGMRSTDGVTNRSRQQNAQKSGNGDNSNLQQTMQNFSKLANTTINRQTILSKLSKHEQVQATKQRRNIDLYREYQDYWDNQAGKMKTLLNKKRPSLVQNNNNIIVEQNPDKLDILNNYVVHYWQMSLRNNNPILRQHIKGNKFSQVELQQLLQRDQGVKQVQQSIPKLPLQKLKRVSRRQLSLTGRSKSLSQNQSFSQRSSIKFSHPDIMNQEEVYKISYEGDKKWLGTEGF